VPFERPGLPAGKAVRRSHAQAQASPGMGALHNSPPHLEKSPQRSTVAPIPSLPLPVTYQEPIVRVIAYSRVSTAEQASSGLGLEAQRSKLAAEAAYRGWEDVTYLEDGGASGKSLDRPAMREALAMLESGQADALCAVKLDRLSRSVVDFVSLLSLSERQGWSLIVLDLSLDTSSANGRFVAQILASVAELERNLIAERTKAALAVKKSQGTRLGRPVTLAPEIRTFICRARSEGYTLQAIADTLTAQGVPSARGGRWAPGTISAVLRSASLD
jgi:DNA invertase Pin-like site-specific DNA recombinase